MSLWNSVYGDQAKGGPKSLPGERFNLFNQTNDDTDNGDSSSNRAPTGIEQAILLCWMPAAKAVPGQPEKPAVEKQKAQDKAPNTPRESDRVLKLRQAIAISDKESGAYKESLEKSLEGGLIVLDLLEVASKAKKADPKKDMATVHGAIEQTQFESRRRYTEHLLPGTTRARLGLEKIATGKDADIAEGEALLLEAVKRRPELLIEAAFNNNIAKAYQEMAQKRAKAGLPDWNGKLDLKLTASDKKSGSGTMTGVNQALADAGKAYEEVDCKTAMPQFKKAVLAADDLPHEKILNERLQQFVQKLELERFIASSEATGNDTTKLLQARKALTDKQWDKYKEYMAPASVRISAGLAMISSGDVSLLAGGKKLIAEACGLRPEVQFSSDYKKNLEDAFTAHFENKVEEAAPAKPEGPPKKVEFKVTYKPISDKPVGPGGIPLVDDMPEKAYFVDEITGPILTVALIYLGYKSAKGRWQRIQARRAEAAKALEAATATPADTANSGEKPATENEKPNSPEKDKTATPEKTASDPKNDHVRPPTEADQDSQLLESERRSTDPDKAKADSAKPIDLVRVELPGGLSMLVDKTMVSEAKKAMEKYRNDTDFRALIEDRIKNEKDDAKRKTMEEEYVKYKGMTPEAQLQARDAILGEVAARVSDKSSGREYSGAKKAVGWGATVMILAMAVELLLPSKAHAPAPGPAVKPKVKE